MKTGRAGLSGRLVWRVVGALLLWGAAVSATAAEFHVAPNGNDANPGTAERPFATLGRARDAVRGLKKGGALGEPVRVVAAAGTYPMSEPFRLGPEDSGTKAAPVSYEAAAGARPVFSGGRVIGGWEDAGDGLWKARVPEVEQGKRYFEQLFVNGRRAVRARTPNKFYFYMQSVAEAPAEAGSGREATQTIGMRPEDFAAVAGLTPEDAKDVNLVAYHKWDVTRRLLDRVDPAAHAVAIGGGKMKSWNPLVKNIPFHLENFRGALDEPGEWFLARDGWLYYRPRPGEEIGKAEVVAPVLDELVVVKGDAAHDKFVEHVALKGLAFRDAGWLTPAGGFGPEQAAASIGAAFTLDGVRNVTIEGCEVSRVATYGVWFRSGCTDCALRHCLVEELGAGGVRIGETRIAPEGPARTARVTVDDCIIRRGGRVFACAVGVWVGQSGENAVTHNEIADFYYTGISAGWTWGYGEGLAKRNTFAFNRVHHIGQGVLSDMGGIYLLGLSEGTAVRNNVFHDVYAYDYGGWGMYTDEGSTGITLENNLVYRTKTGSFHQHYGKENVVRNNILAFSKQHQLQASRVEDHLSFTLEKNIVIWETGEVLSGTWEKMKFESRNNLYWHVGGGPVSFLGHSLEEWQKLGHEQGSRVADPKFADAAHDDYRLAGDSPALELGFKPFDPSEAGVRGGEEWKRLAREAEYPPLEVAPEPPG